MTEREIYKLAWDAQLTVWATEQQYAEKCPGNEIAAMRAQMAWEKLMEIERMIREKGFDQWS